MVHKHKLQWHFMSVGSNSMGLGHITVQLHSKCAVHIKWMRMPKGGRMQPGSCPAWH
jgi:hypothetical protein